MMNVLLLRIMMQYRETVLNGLATSIQESFENKVDGEGEVRGTKEGEKEDVAAAFLLDEEDSSIMRSPPYFLR